MNLLIVNDEELVAETMKQDIPWEEYGIQEVFTAYNTEEGKECVQKEHIDIMLCDIEMPGENGIELLRWVRRKEKEIECIFLTCHASFQYAQEAIHLGCSHYLLIPARYEEIGAIVQKVVDEINQKKENEKYQEYGKSFMKEKIDDAIVAYGDKKTPPEQVKDIADYVMQNLGDSCLTVNKIAEIFYLHPVYLNRIFKKEKKISLSQFIIRQRMELAAELLRTQNFSANAVAEQVGYTAYTNFNLMFKKYYGCSPSHYVDKYKV